MALSHNRDVMLDSFQVGPGVELGPVAQWMPPKGLATNLWVDQLPPEYSAELSNWMPTNGKFEPRVGVATLGSAATVDIVYAGEFSNSAGTQYTLRWLTTKLQVWDGGAWVDITGVTLTGGVDDLIALTTFGDYLIFSNGVAADGTWAVDVGAGTGSQIATVPAFKHLTTFAGRVVGSATPTLPNTIQWSVKNSHTDWSGLGSGSEDLISVPGGVVQQQFGVHPISDNTAWVVRNASIWSMTETGDFDAPFSFARLYDGIGSTSRFGVVAVPGGVALVSPDGMYEILAGGAPNPIGLLVNSRIIASITDFDGCYLLYKPKYDELYLLPRTEDLTTTLWVYNRRQQSWTTLSYDFPTKSIGLGRLTSALSYDSLIGDVDDLGATMDSLGSSTGRKGLIFAMRDPGFFVVTEDFTGGTATDLTSAGIATHYELLAQTGTIKAVDPLYKVGVPYLQITYNATSAPTVYVEYSEDDGQTWDTYVTETLPVTSVPRTWMFRNDKERERLMFRVRCSRPMNLYGFTPYVRRGALIGL